MVNERLPSWDQIRKYTRTGGGAFVLIYIAQMGDYFKIGKTVDLEKIRSEMQYFNPTKVKLIKTFRVEKVYSLHCRNYLRYLFIRKHHRGYSWFKLDEEDLELINGMSDRELEKRGLEWWQDEGWENP